MTDSTAGVCHILVADDEPHIGRIIKMKLEQGPFRVSLAYDGQEALDFVNSEETVDSRRFHGLVEKTYGLRSMVSHGVRVVRGLGLNAPSKPADDRQDPTSAPVKKITNNSKAVAA